MTYTNVTHKNNLQKYNKKPFALKGFTIIEIVVTLAIIGILMLMVVPSFTSYYNNASDTEYDVNAAAINTAVIQTLFPNNGEVVSEYADLNSASSPERDKILRLADLPDGYTIDFRYYDINDVPLLSEYKEETLNDSTWVVYIPVDEDDLVTSTAVFDFTLDVLIFTPDCRTIKKYANTNSVVD